MKPIDCTANEHFQIQDSKRVYDASKRIKKILDAKYSKVNLEELIPTLKHLNKEKQNKLYLFLKCFENMFNGTLGTYTGSTYRIDLKKTQNLITRDHFQSHVFMKKR